MVAVRRGWRRGGNRRGWGISGGITVAITTAPTLFQAVPTAIAGTTNATDGTSVDVTVNGETWGSTTVSSGAWSVTGTPTAAMVGSGVTVAVTIGSGSAETTCNVRALTEFFDGPRGVTDIGGKVSAWLGQVAGVSADQTVDANRPLYAGDAPNFDGASDNLLLDGAVTTDTHHVLMFAVDLDTVAANTYFLDSQTGRLIAGVESGNWKYFNGAWRDSGVAATSGKHILTVVLDATSGDGLIRLDGNQIASGLAYAVPVGISGTTRIASGYPGTGQYVDGKIHGIPIVSGTSVPLTPSEIVELEAQLDAHYGFGVI